MKMLFFSAWQKKENCQHQKRNKQSLQGVRPVSVGLSSEHQKNLSWEKEMACRMTSYCPRHQACVSRFLWCLWQLQLKKIMNLCMYITFWVWFYLTTKKDQWTTIARFPWSSVKNKIRVYSPVIACMASFWLSTGIDKQVISQRETKFWWQNKFFCLSE